MKNNTFIISMCIVGISILFALSMFFFTRLKMKDREPSIDVNAVATERLEKLKKNFKESTYFAESKIEIDEDKLSFTIDKKMEVSLKNNRYVMIIKDPKLEDKYCEIVDVIEHDLGLEWGKSLSTCKSALEGKIGVFGLDVDFNSSYKILSLSNDNKIDIYDESNTHKEEELISLDEINYNIKIDNYILSSLSCNLDNEIKTLNVCGNIFNSKNDKEQDFFLKIFDNNKDELSEKKYTYKNENPKYIPFCIEFNTDGKIPKYYSIRKE